MCPSFTLIFYFVPNFLFPSLFQTFCYLHSLFFASFNWKNEKSNGTNEDVFLTLPLRNYCKGAKEWYGMDNTRNFWPYFSPRPSLNGISSRWMLFHHTKSKDLGLPWISLFQQQVILKIGELAWFGYHAYTARDWERRLVSQPQRLPDLIPLNILWCQLMYHVSFHHI